MKPEAGAVLVGGIKQDESGRWVSTDLTVADNELGAPGGKLRVFAAAELSKQHPEAVIIATGAKGYDVRTGTPEDRPLCAEILRDELIESGVPVERIVLEQNSNSTYQQLQELEKLIAEKGWKHTALITNRYHLPRLRAIIEAKFPQLLASLQPLSAEEVLIEADAARWEKEINDAYESDFMKERIAKEEQGTAQIKEGTYQFR